MLIHFLKARMSFVIAIV